MEMSPLDLAAQKLEQHTGFSQLEAARVPSPKESRILADLRWARNAGQARRGARIA
jgi:hypothetical protein